jgi:hypothetical protein
LGHCKFAKTVVYVRNLPKTGWLAMGSGRRVLSTVLPATADGVWASQRQMSSVLCMSPDVVKRSVAAPETPAWSLSLDKPQQPNTIFAYEKQSAVKHAS